MAKPNLAKQQWDELLGRTKREELVRLLMGIRRSLAENNRAAADLKTAQALRLMGEN